MEAKAFDREFAMNVTRNVPAPAFVTPAFVTPAFLTLALPTLLALAACSDDLESRNAAAGLDEDAVLEAQIESAPRQDNAASDVAMEGDAGEEDEAEETVVEAAPDDLIDSTEGFAPEPMDNAAGFDPSPNNQTSGE